MASHPSELFIDYGLNYYNSGHREVGDRLRGDITGETEVQV